MGLLALDRHARIVTSARQAGLPHNGPAFLGGARVKSRPSKYWAALSQAQVAALEGFRAEPTRLPDVRPNHVAYWKYKHDFYATEDLELDARDVLALLTEAENKRRVQLDRAHSLMAMREQIEQPGHRQTIPREVKLAVWQRDRGRCTTCESQLELEYDHIIPLAMGGSNTERNLQLLCAACNRRKGPTLG